MTKNGLGVLGGALIVAGTSIGAGMLAIPVVTGPAGFFPSTLILVACWAFMTITGILFAELAISMGADVNILTMAKRTLGVWGQVCTWIVYLFLFYCLLIAYLVGGGNLLTDFFPVEDAHGVRIVLFALLFITLVAIGKRIVDPVNRFLMIGLIVSYCGFALIGWPAVDLEYLQHSDWSQAKWALPIAFTSFGYQGTVPTLASWMNYDRKKLRTAIVSGTSLTLCIYILWQALFLGIVPLFGENGLKEAYELGVDAIYPLQFFTENPHVFLLGKCFAFFAIATSFLGVGVGMVDFLADGLHTRKQGMLQRVGLLLLAFGFPFFFALTYPNVFLHALGLAGGFGSAFLLGILPIVMTWRAKFKGTNWFLQSRALFLLLLAFVLYEVIVEVQILFK